MNSRGSVRIVVSVVLLVAAVVLLSLLSNSLWGMKNMKEERPAERPTALLFRQDATIAGFGAENGLPDQLLMNAFGLQAQADLARRMSDLGLSDEEVTTRVRKAMAMHAEFGTKNWVKIPIKLALWLVMVVVAFRLMRRAAVTSAVRKGMYLAAVAVFGIALGNEPSPMNTLTDTAALFGQKGILFPPRVVVLAVFLVIGVLANKFICAWGCQFGTLQDLLFRMNRDRDGNAILKQIKLPFAVTNSVRAVVFILFLALALGWGLDFIAPVNPFKIYAPAAVTAVGGSVLGILLLAALVVYRPWCHFACPFGFLGWLTERFSVFKVQVNYDSCIACEKCSAACPSHAMEGILKGKATKPDCFSCGTCIETCPTGSVAFRKGARMQPPAGKFS